MEKRRRYHGQQGVPPPCRRACVGTKPTWAKANSGHCQSEAEAVQVAWSQGSAPPGDPAPSGQDRLRHSELETSGRG